MTEPLLKIDVLGQKEIYELIGKIPDEALAAGVEDANEYIIDMERQYAPRVQHGEGNPYQWDSEKQRRAYFASNGFGGGIPYRRTQNLARGWKAEGKGVDQVVTNDVPYAKYVKDFAQSRGHMADGWDIIQTDLKNRAARILQKFEGGVKRAIKRLGFD